MLHSARRPSWSRVVRLAAPAALLAMLALPMTLRAQHAHDAPAPARRPAADTLLSGEAARVAATVRALFAAAERGDVAALDTLYAGDSLTVIEGAGINRTWADYRDHHLAPELKEMRNFRYRPSEIEARVAGNVAWATFRYALQADVKERAVDIVGRGTAVLERRGSRWVIRHTHTSGRARRPTDPAMPQ